MERNRIYRDAIRRSGQVDTVSGPAGPPGPSGPAGTITSPDAIVVACIDYDGVVLPGNDSTGRFGIQLPTGNHAADVQSALTAAKATPFKTFQAVGRLLLRFGNNADGLVFAHPRTSRGTYLDQSGNPQALTNVISSLIGWKRFLIRGTLDFINDANDKTRCGFLTASGTNGAGYNASSATVNTLTCTLAGGGAPGFPAEASGYSVISGKRIRFSSTTATVALRNSVSMIWKNTTTQLILSDDLPASPAPADIFWIEEPGLVLGSFSHSTGPINGAGLVGTERKSLTIAGMAISSTASQYVDGGGEISWSGLEFAGTSALTLKVTDFDRIDARPTYVDEEGNSVSIGSSIRANGNTFFSIGKALYYWDAVELGPTGCLLFSVNLVDIGRGSLIATGVHNDGGGGTSRSDGASNFAAPMQIGRPPISPVSTNTRQLRITAVSNEAARGAVDIRTNGSANVQGIDFAGQTRALVKIACNKGAVMTDDLTSVDGGNTDVVIDTTQALESSVLVDLTTASTATAAAGGIRIAGPVLAALADLSTTNYTDQNGNNVMGSAGKVRD
jgi:hypothetical protein